MHHVTLYMGNKMYALTHLPLDKMAAMLADDILKCIFLNENDKNLIQISLKLVPTSPIDNKPALVREMAWHRTGHKPLPEPMMTQFTDIYAALGGDELKRVENQKCKQIKSSCMYHLRYSTI